MFRRAEVVDMTFVDSAQMTARRSGHIKLHGPEGFEGMRRAGQLTARALDLLVPMVKPGVTTSSLDRFIFEFARDNGAYPATLNYRGYRKSTCTSINHVVCHGIPDSKPLRDGDIVDFGERVEDAVRREIAEEIGVEIELTRSLGFVEMFADTQHWVSPIYEARIVSGEPVNREPDKHEALLWADPAAPPSPLATAAREALERLSGGG